MTTYQRSERHYWRYQLRRFAWRITQALAVLVLLLVLLPAAPANAAPSCPGGQRPNRAGQCIIEIDRRTVCGWPMRIDGQRVTYCERQAAEVQP